MRITIILYLFFIQNFAIASSKIEIIKNFKFTENIKFTFSQKINKKIETGDCVVTYPKKIYCEYKNSWNKILVSNGKTLAIISDKNPEPFRYRLEKTPLNLILDKDFLIKKIEEAKNEKELKNSYAYKFYHENNAITIFFDKHKFNLMGWTTTDIYQNKVETKITNVKTNLNLDDKIFDIKKYTN